MTKLEFNLHDLSAYEIVEACAKIFEGIESTEVSIRRTLPKAAIASRADGTLKVSGPSGTNQFVVEAKRRIEASTVPAITARLKAVAQENGMRPFLAAGYINDNIAARLRTDKIAYADAAGNAHFALPYFYVWLRGFGPPVRETESETRAFQASGAQLVALLLIEPEAINWNYRRLSTESGVSLGSVSHILGDLRRAAFIQLADEHTRVIRNAKDLFTRWELSYLERLRPKLEPKTFRLADDAPLEVLLERSTTVGIETILVGGELAAAAKIRRLRPVRATLHVKRRIPMMHVPTYLRLIPATDGNIEIVDHFGSGDAWIWPDTCSTRFAHPLLVHAEMIRYSRDGRVHEAAQELFDDYIAPRLNNDRGQKPSRH